MFNVCKDKCPRCGIESFSMTWHSNATNSWNMNAVANSDNPFKYWLGFDCSLFNGRSVLISRRYQEDNIRCQIIWLERNRPELVDPYMKAIKERDDDLKELLKNSDEKATEFVNQSWMFGNELITLFKGKDIICILPCGMNDNVLIVRCGEDYHILSCG